MYRHLAFDKGRIDQILMSMLIKKENFRQRPIGPFENQESLNNSNRGALALNCVVKAGHTFKYS